MTHPTDADVDAMALLPCPFCGENARWDKSRDWIECRKCRASTYSFDTIDETIAAWNRRAIPPHYIRAVEEREGLIEALEDIEMRADHSDTRTVDLRPKLQEIERIARAILSRAKAPTPEASPAVGEGEGR